MRIFHSSPKTIRGRLYSYFSEQVSRQNTMHIQIPLDRQQLADYLGVERTALSKELGKMKREGLIDFKKNDFMIYL
jgi:CRP-like cAMP-binding protein